MNLSSIPVNKIRIILFFFFIMFFLVIVFLFRWQIVDEKKFEAMATERIKNIEIPALRGSIYARDGSTLAFSERRFDIYAYLLEIERAESYGKQTREEYISKVSKVLDKKPEDLAKLLDDGKSNGSVWILIATKLTYEKKEELVNLKRDNEPNYPLEGNFVEYTSKRIYPEKTLACHVIGYYGYNDISQLVGMAGIEGYWEGSLKALEGFQQEQVDSFGNIITILDFTPIEEQRGVDIYLTIDVNLQKIIESSLNDGVVKYQAESGAAVLIDPKTGEILALANYPNYDPNEYQKYAQERPEVFNNIAVNVPYEFGSVGKIFTVSAAFEEHKVTPDTLILPNGHNGCEFFLDKDRSDCQENPNNCRVCTADRLPQGPMTVAKGLIKSDNIALYHTAKEIGSELLYKYLNAFRIGYPSGVELYESYSYLKPLEKWNEADLVTYSYGHGYQATLLQLISALTGVANDGKMLQPYIVSKIVEPDGTEKIMEPKVISQPISPETARIIGGILNQVYKNSLYEYWNRDLLKYAIAMKSGTALVPYTDRAGYSEDINATYIGYDLSNEKKFILGVWLYKPKGTLSTYNTRTVWINMFRGIKNYLDVPEQ